MLSSRKEFQELLDKVDHEYQIMVNILSNNGKDKLYDCGRVANNGESPVTYADVTTNMAGNFVPMETVLTDTEDYMTFQSLDYIF